MKRRVLILPGWFNSLDNHWQTRWERHHGYERVQQSDWENPRRGDWVAALESAVVQDDRHCVLVAHSLGCILAAHWAQSSAHASRIAGALLVAPPDLESENAPEQLRGFTPVPRTILPFPATVVASSDDEYGRIERSRELARAWNAAFVDIGPRGHINGDSGLGDWPEGHSLIEGWLRN
jgi:predicted alpha/beta hydrolase family esterase